MTLLTDAEIDRACDVFSENYSGQSPFSLMRIVLQDFLDRRSTPTVQGEDVERAREFVKQFLKGSLEETAAQAVAAEFARIRGEERERCAKIAERKHGLSRAQYENRTDDETFLNPYYEGAADAADEIESSIRAT